MNTTKIAILHQANKPPIVNGIAKPMKPGGYKDSGADIAYALSTLSHKWQVVTPVNPPNVTLDSDWSYPDTEDGILQAIKAGASILWANTILFSGHPIDQLSKQHNVKVVGQDTEKVQKYDDKDYTNRLLAKSGLSVPASFLISETKDEEDSAEKIVGLDSLNTKIVENFGVEFPVIAKPIRGRGSQGVKKVDTFEDLITYAKEMFASKDYGNKIMVEEFLSGDEFTVAVFSPGTYEINGKKETKDKYWAAPAVLRVNHHDGVAPYNGVVAVTKNSFVWKEGIQGSRVRPDAVDAMLRECEEAARVVVARAPIRIDCRVNRRGKGILFDLNMKPNMTGPGRPGREDQDNLVGIAVSGIGWNYVDLVNNIASNCTSSN